MMKKLKPISLIMSIAIIAVMLFSLSACKPREGEQKLSYALTYVERSSGNTILYGDSQY